MSVPRTPEQRARRDERMRRWKEANPERYKEGMRRHYEQNREKIIARSAQWAKDNPERRRELGREGARRWAQRNPEKVKELHRRRKLLNPNYTKEYYARNRDRQREKLRKWGEDNYERLRQAQERWRKAHPERHRAHQATRRARVRGAEGFHTGEALLARFAFHGNRCVYCGSEEHLTGDHMIPLARGGSNWPANIVPACATCNRRKHTKTFQEFKAA